MASLFEIQQADKYFVVFSKNDVIWGVGDTLPSAWSDAESSLLESEESVSVDNAAQILPFFGVQDFELCYARCSRDTALDIKTRGGEVEWFITEMGDLKLRTASNRIS